MVHGWQGGCHVTSGRIPSVRQVGAGGYALDSEQSDSVAGGGGVRGGEFVWARPMDQSCGGRANGDDDCARRSGWAHRPAKESGDPGRSSDRHSRRPHDRKRVLHVFRGGGNGVAVAPSFLLCPGSGDGFFAGAGHARGALRVGRERDAADVVGKSAGRVSLESRIVCGNEMHVLLLPGAGIGADARARGAAGGNDGGLAWLGSCWRACFDVDDGSVLFAAWIARVGGGMALCFERGPSAPSEASCARGDVMAREEVKEVNEVKKDVKENRGGVAAFFDLDGTLMPLPSLEKRLFAMLRYRRFVGIRNFVLWLAETVRLIPHGINQIVHANKMYLRGVSVDENNSLSMTSFYPEAVERVAWHAERRHLIVLVSGTLEPLAERAARALEAEFGARGLASTIRVWATRLEERSGRWTGRIVGEAIFGEAKARAIRQIAAEADLDLQRCFAYGDSSSDRWMLDAVGKPAAVNPTNDLARIARRNDWPVLLSGEERNFPQRRQRTDEASQELQAKHANSGRRI
jgi:HAD superfamily hydrolase (TIGR01490 family)